MKDKIRKILMAQTKEVLVGLITEYQADDELSLEVDILRIKWKLLNEPATKALEQARKDRERATTDIERQKATIKYENAYLDYLKAHEVYEAYTKAFERWEEANPQIREI